MSARKFNDHIVVLMKFKADTTFCTILYRRVRMNGLVASMCFAARILYSIVLFIGHMLRFLLGRLHFAPPPPWQISQDNLRRWWWTTG
jgi:hypothetical protein